jgi:glyoxylase-like metal-dependent hydrolase (beta-lactamase superfamily II)
MEIVPGVHMVKGGPAAVYLLIDGMGRVTIVDAGMGAFDRAVLNYLKSIGRHADEVAHIILTHRHVDHVGGASGLREATGAPVLAHPLDASQIAGKWPRGGLRSWVERSLVPLVVPTPPCPVDLPLAHEQWFDLGALGELRVVSTPGHTLGHCSLLLPARKLLILGDALTNRSGPPRVPRAILNDDDDLAHRTAMALALLDVDALAFAHGTPILSGGRGYLQDVARRSEAYLARKIRA